MTSVRDDLRGLSWPVATALVLAALVVLGVKTLGAVTVAAAHALATVLVLAAVLAEWLEAVAADAAGIDPLSTYAAVGTERRR